MRRSLFLFGMALLLLSAFVLQSVLAPERRWQVIKIEGASDLSSVAYGNGLYVATTTSGEYLYLSEDGVNWRAGPAMRPSRTDLTFGGGHFLSIMETGVATSTDGVDWRPFWEENLFIESAAYGNGIFLAVTKSRTIFSSVDGVNWEKGEANYPIEPVHPHMLTFGDGRFHLLTTDGYLLSSLNGIDWERNPGRFTGRLTGLAVGSGRTVVGYQSATDDEMLDILFSWDGAEWTEQRLTSPRPPTRISVMNAWLEVGLRPYLSLSHNGAEFLSVGVGGSMRRSKDGRVWERIRSGTQGKLVAATYGADRWIAVGRQGLVVLGPIADGH